MNIKMEGCFYMYDSETQNKQGTGVFVRDNEIIDDLRYLLTHDNRDEWKQKITDYLIDKPLEMRHGGRQKYSMKKDDHEKSFHAMRKSFFGTDSECSKEMGYLDYGLFCQCKNTDGKMCLKIISFETEDVPQSYFQQWFSSPKIMVTVSLTTAIFSNQG